MIRMMIKKMTSISKNKNKKEYILEMRLWEKVNGGCRLIRRVATTFDTDSSLTDNTDDNGIGNTDGNGYN